METVQSKDGTRITIEKSGSGPALVLVNGAVNDKSAVAPLRKRLEAHFTVVAYDRRGRGDSGDTPPYAPEREVEDLKAVLDCAGGADAFLFGHSSGAILALRTVVSGVSVRALAVNEPPYILEGTRPRPDSKNIASRLRSLIAQGDREGALTLFFTEDVGLPPQALQGMKAAPFWASMLRLAHTTPYDTEMAGDSELPEASLRTLEIPTLVLHGTASFPWIGETTRAMAKLIPGAKLALLEKQVHSPAPDVLAPALIQFFSSRAFTQSR
jgi:pimeloyl-ACP methyl ester carboxylesterase